MTAEDEGKEAGSSAQQSLAPLHSAVVCWPYSLQLEPFPHAQISNMH